MLSSRLLLWLHHPLTRGLGVDDQRTTLLRRVIIQRKPFLRCIYGEWYQLIACALPKSDQGQTQGPVLELGSGGGFLQDVIPGLITSDPHFLPGLALCADGSALPLADNSLEAIVMTNVLHHLPDIAAFLHEANRCLKPGGKVIMIEPWYTRWSYWVYTRLHSEAFLPLAEWHRSEGTGPLSAANGALPWIVFARDRHIFEHIFPHWSIAQLQPLMPVSYLLSGGVSGRNLLPGWLYVPLRALERVLFEKHWAMFALIELEKTHTNRLIKQQTLANHDGRWI